MSPTMGPVRRDCNETRVCVFSAPGLPGRPGTAAPSCQATTLVGEAVSLLALPAVSEDAGAAQRPRRRCSRRLRAGGVCPTGARSLRLGGGRFREHAQLLHHPERVEDTPVLMGKAIAAEADESIS